MVNEIGSMDEGDQSMPLSITEESIFSLSKCGYYKIIIADTTVMISANSASGGSTWLSGVDCNVRIDLDELPVGKPFLDRLDLLFCTSKHSHRRLSCEL